MAGASFHGLGHLGRDEMVREAQVDFNAARSAPSVIAPNPKALTRCPFHRDRLVAQRVLLHHRAEICLFGDLHGWFWAGANSQPVVSVDHPGRGATVVAMATGHHLIVTPKLDQVDDYHGELVVDPYRWLEDTNDPATARWVLEQNSATEAWLARVPTREQIRTRLRDIWDFPRYGVPFERGGIWFQFRNSGLQNQSVLYAMDSPQADGRVLLDPNDLALDGTVAVTGVALSDDGSLLAYATSHAGSDWMTWQVRDVPSGVDRDDLVRWSKFCLATWAKDGSGFYYNAPTPPRLGTEYLEQIGPVRVLFHRLGTSQSQDEVVFEPRGTRGDTRPGRERRRSFPDPLGPSRNCTRGHGLGARPRGARAAIPAAHERVLLQGKHRRQCRHDVLRPHR